MNYHKQLCCFRTYFVILLLAFTATTLHSSAQTVRFTSSGSSGCAPHTVSFNNMSDAGATAYLWDFGQGSTAITRDAGVSYLNPGTFKVTLTVTYPGGPKTYSEDVVVHAKPVYVYCLSGGRSAAAAKWMRENGYKKVVEMDGGVMAWKQAGKTLTGVDAGPQFSIPDFEKALGSEKWTLVDVGAAWCPPCRKMEPVVKQIISEKKLKLVNVDGGKDTEVMNKINAKTLPTFVLYKDGKEVWRKEGIVTIDEFRSVIK